MIKSHGMRVSPEEIEDCIFASHMVKHTVAFAVPFDDVKNNINHSSCTIRSIIVFRKGIASLLQNANARIFATGYHMDA